MSSNLSPWCWSSGAGRWSRRGPGGGRGRREWGSPCERSWWVWGWRETGQGRTSGREAGTLRGNLYPPDSGYWRGRFLVLTLWSWYIMKVFRSSTFEIKIFWRISVGASLACDRVIFTQDVISTSTTLLIATSDTAGRHLSKSFIKWWLFPSMTLSLIVSTVDTLLFAGDTGPRTL